MTDAIKFDPNHALIIYGTGLFDYNTQWLDYEKINDEWGWGNTKAAIWYEGYIFAIGSYGICKINPEDGSYEYISEENWGRAKDMVRIGNYAYVAHRWGIYRLDLDNNCEYDLINEENWKHTTALVA